MNAKTLYRAPKLLAICLSLAVFSAINSLHAAEPVKPFVLAAELDSTGNDIASVVSKTRQKLLEAEFEIVGQYSPYDGAGILVFTNKLIRQTATKSRRGGYGGVLRAAVTLNANKIEVVYTNPVYWANAYRLKNNLDPVEASLRQALGNIKTFGTGDKNFSASDLRKYHYTFMMEYFDDPSLLAYYDSHQQAVYTVATNLSLRVAGSYKVFQINLGSDSSGREMTLFGVGLPGKSKDDCSSDPYIMNKIDRSSPRHTAHLPYEILVYGDQVEALYARFRIAISWPHLPMMASDTGATFLSIMCAPGAIEDSLKAIAGGVVDSSGNREK